MVIDLCKPKHAFVPIAQACGNWIVDTSAKIIIYIYFMLEIQESAVITISAHVPIFFIEREPGTSLCDTVIHDHTYLC